MKKYLLLILIISMSFLLGMGVGLKKSFPYPQLKSLKVFMIGKDRVNSRLYYYKKRVGEFFTYNRNYDIVMLGDSITDRTDWNALFKRKDILNRGISGDSTDGMLQRLESLPKSIKKAFIMIGINDLGKGSTVEYIYNNYIKIIKILQEHGITPIIQSTLYIAYDTGKRKNDDVRHLNDLLKSFTLDNHLTFIDLNKNLSENEHLKLDYTDDGIHLNSQGYKEWAKVIKNYF